MPYKYKQYNFRGLPRKYIITHVPYDEIDRPVNLTIFVVKSYTPPQTIPMHTLCSINVLVVVFVLMGHKVESLPPPY